MPISLIKSASIKYLEDIGFTRPSSNFDYTPNYTLKNTIFSGNGLDVNVLNASKFKVSIEPSRFYEAVSTDFYFSYQKATRQKMSFETLDECKQLPGAWNLVTLYYAAFYSTVEINRLMGLYITNLNENHINHLNAINTTSEKLKNVGSYISNKIELNKIENSIDITFFSSGQKPHQLAWDTLLGRINKQLNHDPTDGHRAKRINLLKDIIDQKNTSWPSPSQLRNDWNYSIVDAYSNSSDKKTSAMSFMAKGFNFNNIKRWGESKIKQIGETEKASSLAYVAITTLCTLEEMKSKVIKLS